MKKWSLIVSKVNHLIQVYSPNTNVEEAEVEQFYEDLQDLLELTPKIDVLFIIEDWNENAGSQEITGETSKFGLGVQNEAGQRVAEFYQKNVLVWKTLSSNNTRDDSTHGHHRDGQYQNQIDGIICSERRRSTIQSAKTRLRADSGSDHELLIAKFRPKLKKVGKTTRPFRNDLTHTLYDNKVDVINRFKELDLVDSVWWAKVRSL